MREVSGSHSFGIVLLLIVLTVGWTATVDGTWGAAGSVVLQAATTLFALWAAKVPRRVFLPSIVAVIVIALGALAAVVDGEDTSRGVAGLLTMILIATVPAAIVYGLRKTEQITAQTISGALCIYLLLGFLFTTLYNAIQDFSSTGFFVETTTPNSTDFIYYSYITLTTVGYGDLTAAGDLGRTLSAFEALVGQLYLVTVVALVVASFSQARRASDAPGADVDRG